MRESLTSRQLVAVDLYLLAALALMLNRGFLPASWRPEVRLQPSTLDMARAVTPQFRENAFKGENAFTGKSTLLVGDSLAAHWPIEADYFWVAGAAPREILLQLPRYLGDRRYEIGIVACGTGSITRRDPLEQWLPDLDRLIAFVSERADRVIVLTPVPGLLQPDGSVREYILEAQAARHIQRTWSGRVQVFHTDAFYQEFPQDVLRKDHCHLTPYGFQQLLARLDVPFVAESS